MRVKSIVRSWAAERFVTALDKRGFQLTRPRFHEENSIDLRALLAEAIERQNGTVVVLQIGANDGVMNDPVHDAVISRGWHLYAVEPVPTTFARLEKNYAESPKVRCIPGAVGTEDGETPLYTIRQDRAVEGFPYHQFASFSRDVVERHWRYIPDVKDRVETIAVPTYTLTSLVEKFEIPRIDLLQIDTEGFDYEIIKMAFSAKIAPPILAFEWAHLSRSDMWDCRCALIEHGYRWLIDKGDVIAVRDAR